jgi:hypothetical protein
MDFLVEYKIEFWFYFNSTLLYKTLEQFHFSMHRKRALLKYGLYGAMPENIYNIFEVLL